MATDANYNTQDASSKTILQVVPAMEQGGVERGTVEIARALVAAGWRAVVASAGGRMVAELEQVGGRHVTLPLAGKSPFLIRSNITRLENLIAVEQVDLLHARSRAPAWSAKFAARRASIPFVTTYHSPYGDSWLKRPYNAVMASGDRVIAISDYVADVIRRRHHIDENRMVRIHRGVDLDHFDPAKVAQERVEKLAQSWQLTDDMPVILLPGRLTRWKGQLLAIEALARLQNKKAVLVLVGNDQGRKHYSDELKAQIGQLKLTDRVRLPGDCRDMAAAYMLADVVVSASIEPEGFGRVSAEGQAMGKPVVATNHGGSMEIVLDRVTGALVANNDAAAMAGAFDQMLNLDSEARRTLATKARDHVEKNFSVARMCADTLAVYRDLLDTEA